MVQDETSKLLKERQLLEQELTGLVYGSVEVREKAGEEYIYVHYREEGRSRSRYVGEYTRELHNLILQNNVRAKQIKARLKEILKRLTELNYVDEALEEKVAKNIDLARRHLVSEIYDQAILEGVATTFVQTRQIVEGGIVRDMATRDILKILNLKHAWEFVLSKGVIQSETNLGLLMEINRLVEEHFYFNAGKIRNIPVRIGGTKWAPELPIESVIKEELEEIMAKRRSVVERAIDLMLFVMKKQIFVDGNKRTAVIFANHYLIARGKGLLMIPAAQTEKFRELLMVYYEKGVARELREFLENDCYLALK